MFIIQDPDSPERTYAITFTSDVVTRIVRNRENDLNFEETNAIECRIVEQIQAHDIGKRRVCVGIGTSYQSMSDSYDFVYGAREALEIAVRGTFTRDDIDLRRLFHDAFAQAVANYRGEQAFERARLAIQASLPNNRAIENYLGDTASYAVVDEVFP